MRTVDLALYADALAARTSAVAARLERARDALTQAAIERAARRVLSQAAVERLERIGALGRANTRELRREIGELAADLAALEELQGWVESRLAAGRDERELA